MGLCLPRSRWAISAARRPSTLSAASITNQSWITSCGLAEKVFTTPAFAYFNKAANFMPDPAECQTGLSLMDSGKRICHRRRHLVRAAVFASTHHTCRKLRHILSGYRVILSGHFSVLPASMAARRHECLSIPTKIFGKTGIMLKE